MSCRVACIGISKLTKDLIVKQTVCTCKAFFVGFLGIFYWLYGTVEVIFIGFEY